MDVTLVQTAVELLFEVRRCVRCHIDTIIAGLLDGEMSVSALASSLNVTESAVSHQLRGLRRMHLVRTRKEGSQVFYTLDDDHVTKLFHMGLDHVEHG